MRKIDSFSRERTAPESGKATQINNHDSPTDARHNEPRNVSLFHFVSKAVLANVHRGSAGKSELKPPPESGAPSDPRHARVARERATHGRKHRTEQTGLGRSRTAPKRSLHAPSLRFSSRDRRGDPSVAASGMMQPASPATENASIPRNWTRASKKFLLSKHTSHNSLHCSRCAAKFLATYRAPLGMYMKEEIKKKNKGRKTD